MTTPAFRSGGGSAIKAQLARVDSITDVADAADASGNTVWTLRCTDTAAALDTALALLRDAGQRMQEVRVVEPTLEDAFLTMTGRRLT